jgi:hypothetical protein
MEEVTHRAPRDDDWSAILNLAHRSLEGFPAAPGQHQWMENRRTFSPSDGTRQQFVACSGERIVGYACVERRKTAAEGWYRLFMVVEPSARATIGRMLFGKLWERLISLDARHAWMIEFDADVGFVAYLEGIGFVKGETLELDEGNRAIRLTMDAPFQGLAEAAVDDATTQ